MSAELSRIATNVCKRLIKAFHASSLVLIDIEYERLPKTVCQSIHGTCFKENDTGRRERL